MWKRMAGKTCEEVTSKPYLIDKSESLNPGASTPGTGSSQWEGPCWGGSLFIKNREMLCVAVAGGWGGCVGSEVGKGCVDLDLGLWMPGFVPGFCCWWSRVKQRLGKEVIAGTSLEVQWLRLCHLMQEAWVQSLVGEVGPTCLEAKKPKHKIEAIL